MADDLDPRLEASLRAALHHEADQLPLLVRSEDIERARRRRGGRRLALPASLLAAAAVVAVLVIVAGAWRANQSIVATSPTPSLSAADAALLGRLPGFDRLRETTLSGSIEVLREEGVSGPDASFGSHTFTEGPFTYEYVLACLGVGSMNVWLSVDGVEASIGRATCDGGLNRFWWSGQNAERELNATTVSVRLEASTGTAWRMLVADNAPSITPAPATHAADRELDSFGDLRSALVALSPTMPIVVFGEHLEAGGETGVVSIDEGSVGAYDELNVAYDCAGGDITIAIMDGDTVTFSGSTTCGAASESLTDGAGSAAAGNRVVVTADAAVRWRMVVAATPATPGISPTCVPLSGGYTGRGLDIGNGGRLPIPIDSIGTLAWHTFEGTTVAGSSTNVPALGGPLAVNLADGLIVDPGQHCFAPGGVTAGIISLDDYEAARASGATPSFTSLPVDGKSDTSAVTVRLRGTGTQLAGGHVIRLAMAWHRSDGKDDTETWLLPIEVVRTGIGQVLAYDDLAMYSGDTSELLRAEHTAISAAGEVVAGDLGAARTVEVVVSCDAGTVELRFQAAGLAYPVAGTVDCAQPVVGFVLPSPVLRGTASQLVVDAPAGTTWRLIAYDHDAGSKPSIEEALPLPTPKPGRTVEGVIMSLVAGGAPSNNSIEVAARPNGTTFEVVYACEGAGDIHVTIDGSRQDSMCATLGRLRFTSSGFGPSVLTVTSDRTVLLHLELWSSAP